MTVLSINKTKQIQFVGKNFMRNFKPVMEVFDFCESKKVCLLSSGIDSSSHDTVYWETLFAMEFESLIKLLVKVLSVLLVQK